ncbi:MAG TPA: hypothetical protein VMV41_09615 [Cellulomonadaceae bacterium]|nr:hypothetical protein [Cellulomonadaceae bacterium]
MSSTTAVEPVSAALLAAKSDAQFLHVTVGVTVHRDGGLITLPCACGMLLTNGPGWSLDEHIRLHRAEARFIALSAAAPAGIPRLVAAFTPSSLAS